jgi:hypothetical protein
MTELDVPRHHRPSLKWRGAGPGWLPQIMCGAADNAPTGALRGAEMPQIGRAPDGAVARRSEAASEARLP